MRAAPLGALALLASLGVARAAPSPPALAFPLACQIGRSCEVQHYVDRDAGPGVRDYKCSARTYDKHNGIDIRLLDMTAQRAGVDVLAAAPGRVARLRDGVADVSIRAPGAPSVAGQECGNQKNREAGSRQSGWPAVLAADRSRRREEAEGPRIHVVRLLTSAATDHRALNRLVKIGS